MRRRKKKSARAAATGAALRAESRNPSLRKARRLRDRHPESSGSAVSPRRPCAAVPFLDPLLLIIVGAQDSPPRQRPRASLQRTANERERHTEAKVTRATRRRQPPAANPPSREPATQAR